jgi:hypothetical protein
MASHQPQQYRSATPAGHNGRTNSRFDEQGGTRLSGAIGSAPHHAHRTNHKVLLVLYPGEAIKLFVTNAKGKGIVLSPKQVTTVGRLYVVGGRGESYEAVGGPPPGKEHADVGGHTAGSTPAGLFTLGPQEHHTTLRWPHSSIPFGAKLRLGADGFVEYLHHHEWKKANGPHGVWTKALLDFRRRDNKPAVVDEKDLDSFHQAAYKDGKLRPEWIKNDFGEWSWNLMRHGKRTPFYLHTTPLDEYFKRTPGDPDAVFSLVGQSHGCVHVLPRDRDEMIQRGYLKKGAQILVMPYERRGPPKDWAAPSPLRSG